MESDTRMAVTAEALALAWRHHQAGNLAAAEQLYRQVLEAEPAHGDALALLGALYLAQNRWAEAEAQLQYAAEALPDSAPVFDNRGIALARLGRPADAEASFRRALELEPNHAETHINLALALEQQSRIEEAVASMREALRLSPRHAIGWNRLGTLLLRLGNAEEAVAAYDQALVLKPDFAMALDNRGVAVSRLGRWHDAVAQFREALRLQANNATALNNLGHALTELTELDEAVVCLRRALELDPQRAEIHNNLGVAFTQLNRLNDAAACFERSLQLRPDYAEPHRNRGIISLAQGDYERGWPEYAWRWKCKDLRPRPFTQPLWDGTPLAGRTILLHAEQGLGDTLQFIRYARLVKEQGGAVVFECPKPLVKLLANVSGIDRLFPAGECLPDFDVHAPLLDLPGIFGTTLATAPASVPYLTADPGLVESWRRELASLPGLKVGIVWRGNARMQYDRYRSVPLRALEPLGRLPGVHLISLQKGPAAEEIADVSDAFPVIDFGNRLDKEHGPFADTAAVMKCLDLVISVDTAAAHLAGALGVPVLVLLPCAAEWRWLRDREDSPWYPTARLFRQTRMKEWGDVVARIAQLVVRTRDRAGFGPV
jgi:tetratricopeptide (TPR) repeat protein